ncbi:MAG: hypothetical protein DRN06_06380 [Thermoprotei archaeon]|nr:MAG: hypothetical protein DRN06_06380 [Thermoprotei archaeon]
MNGLEASLIVIQLVLTAANSVLTLTAILLIRRIISGEGRAGRDAAIGLEKRVMSKKRFTPLSSRSAVRRDVDRLMALAKSLMEVSEGVEIAVLSSREGFPIASEARDEVKGVEEVAAVGAALLASTESTVRSISGGGSLELISVRLGDGRLLTVRAFEDVVLSLVSSEPLLQASQHDFQGSETILSPESSD